MKGALIEDVQTYKRRPCLLGRPVESEVHLGGVGHRFGQPCQRPGFPFESTSLGSKPELDHRVVCLDLSVDNTSHRGLHKGGYNRRVEHEPRSLRENIKTLSVFGVAHHEMYEIGTGRRRASSESPAPTTRFQDRYGGMPLGGQGADIDLVRGRRQSLKESVIGSAHSPTNVSKHLATACIDHQLHRGRLNGLATACSADDGLQRTGSAPPAPWCERWTSKHVHHGPQGFSEHHLRSEAYGKLLQKPHKGERRMVHTCSRPDLAREVGQCSSRESSAEPTARPVSRNKSFAEFDKLENKIIRLCQDPAQLKKLWDDVDYNGNGDVSLAEFDKWVVENYPCLNNKLALTRCYKCTIAIEKKHDGFVHRRDFKRLVANLFYFNKLYWIFDHVDGDDRRITAQEFKQALALCNCNVSDAEAQRDFQACDSNGGGMILFDEFCRYFASRACPHGMTDMVDDGMDRSGHDGTGASGSPKSPTCRKQQLLKISAQHRHVREARINLVSLDGQWNSTRHSGQVMIKDLMVTWQNGHEAQLEHVPKIVPGTDSSRMVPGIKHTFDFKMNSGGKEYFAKYQSGKLVWSDGDAWQMQQEQTRSDYSRGLLSSTVGSMASSVASGASAVALGVATVVGSATGALAPSAQEGRTASPSPPPSPSKADPPRRIDRRQGSSSTVSSTPRASWPADIVMEPAPEIKLTDKGFRESRCSTASTSAGGSVSVSASGDTSISPTKARGSFASLVSPPNSLAKGKVDWKQKRRAGWM